MSLPKKMARTNTNRDAGPYFCLGLVLASDPELGTDVTIHRLCVQNKDEMSIFFAPSRHIDAFRKRAEAAGRPFPISVNMGLDPAIHIGARFEAPTTPLGKTAALDAGKVRQAALVALGVYSELKNIILVDVDVDVFDSSDVLWAMTTRLQGDRDIIVIPGVSGHILDPSQSPEYNMLLPARGTTAKAIFDATVPFHLKKEFTRAQFCDVDPRPFAPDLDLEYPVE